MKRYFALFLALCLTLSGCGKRREQAVYTTVLRRDVPIALNAPAGPVLTALGAPVGYGERRGTGRPGVEKTYRFAGLRLQTFESRTGERILGVTITDRETQTPEGIAVGDSAAAVRSCFGMDAIQADRCTIRREQEELEILLQNGVVTAISYTLL